MRNLMVCLAVFLNLASSASADEKESLIQSVTFRAIFANKYLANSIGFTVYNKPVVQSSLSVGFKNDFHVDLWNSTPLEQFNQNFGTELDFGFGWSGLLSALGTSKSSDTVLDLGISYFDEPSLLDFGADDILYSYVKLSGTAESTLYALYENYTVMPGSSYAGGHHFGVGLDRGGLALDDWTSMNFGVAAVYDTGALGFSRGIFFRGNLGLNWEMGEHVKILFPQFEYCMPVTARDHPSDLVLFAGFSCEF